MLRLTTQEARERAEAAGVLVPPDPKVVSSTLDSVCVDPCDWVSSANRAVALLVVAMRAQEIDDMTIYRTMIRFQSLTDEEV